MFAGCLALSLRLSLISAVAERRVHTGSATGAPTLEGAPLGGGRARAARRDDLRPLPAAHVYITSRYIEA